MSPDPEITALNTVYEALKGLNPGAIKRTMTWVSSRFESERPGEPVKKRPVRKPNIVAEEKPGPQPVVQKLRGLLKYDTL
jgi:hypothetical protein